MSYYSYNIFDCSVQYNRADRVWLCQYKYGRQRLYYILDGEAWFFNNGIEYPVSAGDICIFPVNLEFIMKQYSERKVCLLYFDFETIPPIISDRIYTMRAADDPVALHILGSLERVFEEIKEANPSLPRVFYPQNGTDSRSRIICLLFDALLTRLSDRFGIEYKLDPVIRQSVEYINDNFTNDIHVSDLSKMAHLCPDHYTRLFKANMNSTPYQYLMSLRLNRALALKDQGIGGEELLKLTGFRNLDSLSKAIRRERPEHDIEK